VRQWWVALGVGLACAPAYASGSASANLAVSVTVMDQCLIHSDSRSATCAGGSAFALGVGRERIAVARDQLTTADEHAHTAPDGSRLGTSQSVAGATGQQGLVLAGAAVRSVAETVEPIDALRITYSF
jgi:hypothetical protein